MSTPSLYGTNWIASGNYEGGTLKVYRKRVEPSGTQTEIYSETFTETTAEEDYPVSVSSVILADDRSKFYFVLDYHGRNGTTGQVRALHHRQIGIRESHGDSRPMTIHWSRHDRQSNAGVNTSTSRAGGCVRQRATRQTTRYLTMSNTTPTKAAISSKSRAAIP